MSRVLLRRFAVMVALVGAFDLRADDGNKPDSDGRPIPRIRANWPVSGALISRTNFEARFADDPDAVHESLSERDVLITDLTADAGDTATYAAALGALRSERPWLRIGTYLNPRCARKVEDWRRYPPETLPYEQFADAYYKGPYETGFYENGTPIDRAWFRIQNPGVRVLVSREIVAEVARRSGPVVMFDNALSGDEPWETKIEYLAGLTRALEPLGRMTLGNIGTLLQLRTDARLETADFRGGAADLEAVLHGIMIERLFPDEPFRGDLTYLAAATETLRFWLKRRMAVVLLSNGDPDIATEQAYLATLLRDAQHPCLFVSGEGREPAWMNLPAFVGAPLDPPRVGWDGKRGPFLTRTFDRFVLTYFPRERKLVVQP